MKSNPSHTLSIIIPVLNEEPFIGSLLRYIRENSNPKNIKEILVVDGGSADETAQVAIENGATLLHAQKGRAKQMNAGAKRARGDIFYFLHVDTYPPQNFDRIVLEAYQAGHEAGCFRLRFDNDSRFLRFFSWFTRLNFRLCRGGDQSLFVSRERFQELQGFNEAYVVYEDSEFIGRLYRTTGFTVLPQRVTTSARKYEQKGMVKLQFHFGMIHLKNYFGAGPDQLYHYYRRNISES